MSFLDAYTYSAAVTLVAVTTLLIWAMTAQHRSDRGEDKRMRADESKRREAV